MQLAYQPDCSTAVTIAGMLYWRHFLTTQCACWACKQHERSSMMNEIVRQAHAAPRLHAHTSSVRVTGRTPPRLPARAPPSQLRPRTDCTIQPNLTPGPNEPEPEQWAALPQQPNWPIGSMSARTPPNLPTRAPPAHLRERAAVSRSRLQLESQPEPEPEAAMRSSSPPRLPRATAAPMLFCLSFASKGNARVEELKAGIEAQGHRVFYGPDIRSAIAVEQAIAYTAIVLLLFTDAVTAAPWRPKTGGCSGCSRLSVPITASTF
jgi:hypothetical protein